VDLLRENVSTNDQNKTNIKLIVGLRVFAHVL